MSDIATPAARKSAKSKASRKRGTDRLRKMLLYQEYITFCLKLELGLEKPMAGPDNCQKCGYPLVAGTCDNGCDEPLRESTERMLKWFEYKHLPEHLQDVSRDFSKLAHIILAAIAPGPERTVALRKLLEAKDAAVRARLHPGG